MTSPDPSRTALADLIAHQESVDDYITIQIPADQRDDVVAILRADDSARRTYETALEARYEELLRAPTTLNSGADREALTRRIELARGFIAREYNDPAQELHGDWIDPRAKPAHDALCLCLQDLSALHRTVEGGAVIERRAKWHEQEADLLTNSLHCGDNSQTIGSAHRQARWHLAAAKSLRALSQPNTGDGK